jgi:ubiquinone/menaquinone biosynthesis C-methylase UbiE
MFRLPVDYYEKDYIRLNPQCMEANEWKFSKIKPLLDELFRECMGWKEVRLLDIGANEGLILKRTASYLQCRYRIRVHKIGLDISHAVQEAMKRNNPDLLKALNEDARKTSLLNKEVDIALMIDVLEHIPQPEQALRELQRVAKYAVLKVPLEKNVITILWNILIHNRERNYMIQRYGHINTYSFPVLLKQVREYLGSILAFGFTNEFAFALENPEGMSFAKKAKSTIGRRLFNISPKLSSLLCGDFVMLLVKCY